MTIIPYPDPICGFFKLELPPPRPWLHESAMLLATGRACFEHVLLARQPARVFLPKFTCDVMLEPLRRNGTSVEWYAINERLEIADELDIGAGDMLVYTNYFGVKDAYCRTLAERHGSALILDCSQALFFAPPPRAHVFYSPRKFAGLPDGGCLISDLPVAADLPRDSSASRYGHLVGRLDAEPEAAYPLFKRNDAALSGVGLKRMSRSTEQLLRGIDWERIRRIRRGNFAALHQALGSDNGFDVPSDSLACPMVYPFVGNDPRARERLGAARIFVATYWPNVLQWCAPDELEHRLAVGLLPLPIDQRYGGDDMRRIVDLLR